MHLQHGLAKVFLVSIHLVPHTLRLSEKDVQETAELLRNPAEAARLGARPERDTGAMPPPELLKRLGEDAAACAEADGVYSPRCDAARQAAGDPDPNPNPNPDPNLHADPNFEDSRVAKLDVWL